MKTYEEMAKSVLKSVNERKIKRNTRNEILKRAVPLCCMCLILIGSVIFFGEGNTSLSVAATGNGSDKSSPNNTAASVSVSASITGNNSHNNSKIDDAASDVSDTWNTLSYNSEIKNEVSDKGNVLFGWHFVAYENYARYYELVKFMSEDLESFLNSEQEIINKSEEGLSEEEKSVWTYIGTYSIIQQLDVKLGGLYFAPQDKTNNIESSVVDLWERDLETGIRTAFYKNLEDCRKNKEITAGEWQEGMVMKVYCQYYEYNTPDGLPKEEDVPYVIAEQLKKDTSVKEIQELLPFISNVRVYMYSDNNEKIEMSSDETLSGVNNIEIDYTYKDKTYNVPFQRSHRLEDDEKYEAGNDVWYYPVIEVTDECYFSTSQ